MQSAQGTFCQSAHLLLTGQAEDRGNLGDIGGNFLAETLAECHTSGVDDGVNVKAQDSCHCADVLGELVGEGTEDGHSLLIAAKGAVFNLTEILGAEVGEDACLGAEQRLDFTLAHAAEAQVDNGVDRQCTAAVQTHAAVVLDVKVVHYATLFVGGDGHAATHVDHNKIQLLVGLTQLSGSLAGDRFVVECVEEALTLHALQTGDASEVAQLINTDGVDKVGRDAQRSGKLL